MANIPALTAGRYYEPGSAPGYSMGVPRDWSHGGKQYYDPQYAYQLPTQQPSTASYANQQMGGSGSGSMARYDQWKPKTMTPKPASNLPWQEAAFGGGAGASTGAAGFGNITTSIEPRPIYSEDMTRAATNLAVADQHKAGFLPDLMKRYDRTGISRGAGQTAKALGDAAGYNQAARRAAVQLPLEDAFANAGAIQQGQVAREGEAQGLAGVLLKMLGNQQALKLGVGGAQNDLFGAGMNLANSLFN